MVCLGEYQDRVIYMLLYAAIHLGAWLVMEPVFEGKTCKALPSAVVFLIIFGILVRAASNPAPSPRRAPRRVFSACR